MPSLHKESYNGWHPDAVPRQQKKWLNFLSLRFGAIICTIAPIVCFAWAYTQHDAGVVATDGLGRSWSGINLGTVGLQGKESLVKLHQLTAIGITGLLRICMVLSGICRGSYLQLHYSSRSHHIFRLPRLACTTHNHLLLYARARRMACWWLRIF